MNINIKGIKIIEMCQTPCQTLWSMQKIMYLVLNFDNSQYNLYYKGVICNIIYNVMEHMVMIF